MAVRIAILLLAAAAAHAGFFVPDRQYRFCTAGVCPSNVCPGEGCNTPAQGVTPQPAVERQTDFKIAYIEFRGNGQPWDLAQLRAARTLIEQERARTAAAEDTHGGPATLFFYIHGWKNNADDREGQNDDVDRFRNYLKQYVGYIKPELRIDTGTAPAHIRRPVLGIYLAWPGRRINAKVIEQLTFWSRSAAARRVGKGQLEDQLTALARRASDGRARMSAERRPSIIVIGHSFGARVLETVLLSRDRNSEISGRCSALVNQKQTVRAWVDLVLFENAATAATYVGRHFRDCQPCGRKSTACGDVVHATADFSRVIMTRHIDYDRDYCREPANFDSASCQPYPLLVSISSRRDWATRWGMFLISFQKPASFVPWLQSHKVTEVPDGTPVNRRNGDVFAFQTGPPGQSGQTRQPGQPVRTFMVSRDKEKKVTPANPIWIMSVSGDIVKDHGDVWNRTFMNMLINLMSGTDEAKSQTLQDYDTQRKMAPIR